MRRSAFRVLLFSLVLFCSPLWLRAAPPSPGPDQHPAVADSHVSAKACLGKLLLPMIAGNQAVCSETQKPGPGQLLLDTAPTTSLSGCCKCSEDCCPNGFCYDDRCRFILFC